MNVIGTLACCELMNALASVSARSRADYRGALSQKFAGGYEHQLSATRRPVLKVFGSNAKERNSGETPGI
jgi:hypothetical protein